MAYTPSSPEAIQAMDNILKGLAREELNHITPERPYTHMSATAEAPRVRTKTNYQVFTAGEEGVLTPLGSAEGLTDIDAIKAITAKEEIEEGSFVAIPARSYRVRTIKAEVTRRVTVS